MMGNRLPTLIVVEGEAAQAVVGEPIVLKRAYMVLAGGLPMAIIAYFNELNQVHQQLSFANIRKDSE